MFRFREFPVYQEARRFRKALKELTRAKFPPEETYVLRAQLWRALDSVLLNVAEGSEKNTDLDFGRFLNQAVASMFEVAACLDAAIDDGYISEREHAYFLQRGENITYQLLAFSRAVRVKPRKRLKSSVIESSVGGRNHGA